MRRRYHLFESLVSFENLLRASRKARLGKRFRENVAQFEFDLERNLLRLRRELIEGSYQPGEYRSFWITDPKPRLISAAPYRDRVVHHALCSVIEPVFERTFIHGSVTSSRLVTEWSSSGSGSSRTTCSRSRGRRGSTCGI